MNKLTRLLVFTAIVYVSSCFAKTIDRVSYPSHALTQESYHSIETKRIVNQLLRNHYLSFALDDSRSEKIFDDYIDRLDPKRILFLTSDLANFAQKRTQLKDELKTGKLTTAYELFALMQVRAKAQYEYALKRLEQPFSFDDSQETLNLDRSKAQRAKNVEEQHRLWDKFFINDVITLKIAGKSSHEIKSTLTQRYDLIQKRLAQNKSEDVFNQFINTFTATLDPHTNYLSPVDTDNFMSAMSLSLEGIGAVIQQSEDNIIIASLVPNGPAAKSKQLEVGNKIIGVGQGNKKIVDVMGWRLDDVITLIKGPKGTKVRIEVIPEKGQKSRIVTLQREEIKFEDGKVKKEIKQIGEQSVAILTIPSFYLGVTNDTRELLKTIVQDNITATIVDLRMNGGGALLEAIALSELFLPSDKQNPIVQVKMNNHQINVLSQQNVEMQSMRGKISKSEQPFYFNKPLVVLVDNLSGSASEIFAAAMQDYQRAVIIGETTFGKGTVQESLPLARIYDQWLSIEPNQLGSLRYTTQKFYRVTGESTQLKGVTPDLFMQSITGGLNKLGEKHEKNPLPWDKIEAVNYHKVYKDWPALIRKLTIAHEKRLQDNKDYQFMLNYIKRYTTNKEDQLTLPLNLTLRQKLANDEEKMVLEYINYQLIKMNRTPITSLDNVSMKEVKWPDINLDEAILVALDVAQWQKTDNRH